MEKLKQARSSIQEWQQEDKKNRVVIVLAAEISNENEKGFEQENLFGISGYEKNLIRLLKDALSDNDRYLAKLVKRAISELVIESITKKAGINE